MAKAENYHVEENNINGIDLRLVTYKIGDKYYCHVENKNPGATIARSTGTNLEQARTKAIVNVTEKL